MRANPGDVNRPACRDAPFRRDLRARIKANRSRLRFVLDVHSFTDEAWDFAAAGIELVVLDDDLGSASGSAAPYTLDFARAMRAAGIGVKVMAGEKNDIHARMRHAFGLRSFLLEFNESLDKKRLRHAICPAVARWLAK